MKSCNDFDFQNHFANLRGIRIVFIGFIVATLLSATAALTAPQERAETNGDVARVLALETLWNQAEVDKDTRALGQIVPATFIYVDIDGSLSTKAEFLDNIKNGPEKPSEIRNESMVAQTYENAVVVTGVYREKGSSNGKRYSRRGRFTVSVRF